MTWLLAAVLLVGCSAGGTGKPADQGSGAEKPAPVVVTPPAPEKLPQNPMEVQKAIGARADSALGALKAQDMAKLAALVHPTKGVRFSPYLHVNTQQDVVLKADQVKTAIASTQVYTWGVHDGSGEPIKRTFADYYKQFIYDLDFTTAPKVGWSEILGKGTILDNVKEAYPEGVFVEYHFPGVDAKYQGMDWRSLRLIFEREGQQWYLTGIMHGQWTT
jgi:hypothetical protein